MAKHAYNPNYFDGTNLKQMRPVGSVAYRTYAMADGTLIGLYQGKRGASPELDFVVKMLIPGATNKPVAPTHTYWVVDLLLKIPQYRKEVREIIDYYIRFYQEAKPFVSVKERNEYQLQTVGHITEKYKHLEQDYTLSLDYVATMIELFCKNEKLAPNAYWFHTLLLTLRDYMDGKKHFTQVLAAAEPGWR